MDIHSLHCFCVAYEVHSIGKAAEQVFLSRQALSRIIKNLEAETGHLLFIRSAQGLNPTSFAALVYPKAIDLLNSYDEVRSVCFGGEGQQRVRLCVAYGVLNAVPFEQFIKQFEKAHPYIKVDIDVLEPSMSEKQVADGLADLALIVGTYRADKTDCVSFGDVLLYAAIRKNLLKKSPPYSMKDLTAFPWFGLAEDFPVDAALLAFSKEQGFALRMAFDYHDYHLILEQMLQGQGVCLVPEYYVNHLCPDDVVAISIDGLNLAWEISVLLPAERKLSKSVQEVYRALAAQFS